MPPEALLAHLRLPTASVIERRVAKSDLAGRLPTPADRRLAEEHIDTLVWYAALNAATVGLPAGGKSGLGVVTLAARHSEASNAEDFPTRLLALVHRAVPDPLLVVVTQSGRAASLSVNPDLGGVLACALPDALPPDLAAGLAMDRAASLGQLHDRWCATVLALQAHAVCGKATAVNLDPAAVAAGRGLLHNLIALDADIVRLQTAARAERQHRRRAELNERLQQVRRQRQEAANTL